MASAFALNQGFKKTLDNNFITNAVLMDLSEGLDCITQDLLITKQSLHGFDEKSSLHIYFFLENRKQCVRINRTNSGLQIVHGVLQGSTVNPLF